MTKYQLGFCTINKLSENIAEVIIDNNVEVSLEMVEEHDEFLRSIFKGNFGVLVNKINTYFYTVEATLSMGSIAPMKAIASVNYTPHGNSSSQEIKNRRGTDKLNWQQFSGLELGWQQAYDWLTQELLDVKATSTKEH